MIYEVWRPIVGYEGLYSVSDLGQIRKDCDFSIVKSYVWGKGYLRRRTGSYWEERGGKSC
jgi:hypothetical protein